VNEETKANLANEETWETERTKRLKGSRWTMRQHG